MNVIPCICWIASVALASPPDYRVPEGFVVEKVAEKPAVVFPMFAAFDDRGRLFVAESSGLDLYAELSALTRKCRIRLLEDLDGDGHFESARVFADGLVFPMGLAWRNGKLFVADPPDLITLEDTDDDGLADRRGVVLSGFGHKDNGSLHGITFGPDGLLYMTMGQPDGYRLPRGDGGVLAGRTGALIRCRPDGSEVEVLSRGFENLVEVVFLPAGEIVGTDNWFQLPSAGLRDALVHLVEGGLYPRHPDGEGGTPFPVTGPPLPAVSIFPAVALSGLARYRGAAFPEDMRGNLFSAQHNTRTVGLHFLAREGSTFRTKDFEFMTSDSPDFHPSDVLEDADGSLLVVDTGGWYVQHCPTGKIRASLAPGGIYRIRYAAAPSVDDPWGLAMAWQGVTPDTLASRLDDPRPSVRDRAQATLTALGGEAVPVLGSLSGSSSSWRVKEHAVRALQAISHGSALPELRKLLHTKEPDLLALVSRALGVLRDRQSAPELSRLLGHDAAHVQMAAAEALARSGDAKCVAQIQNALCGETDRFLEHALIHALYRIASDGDLKQALEHPHPRVRKAALLILDQPPRNSLRHETVMACITSPDPGLRRTALGILRTHPEWAESAVEVVRGWLEKPDLSSEEAVGLESLVVAFHSHSRVVEHVRDFLSGARSATFDGTRARLLAAIASGDIEDLPDVWVEAIAGTLRDSAPRVREAAVRSAAILQVPGLDSDMLRIVDNPEEPQALRMEALRAIVSRQPALSPASFGLLLDSLDAPGEPLRRLAAAETIARSRLSDFQLEQVIKAVRHDALIRPGVFFPLFCRHTAARVGPVLLEYLEDAQKRGWLARELDLREVLSNLPGDLEQRGERLVERSRRGREEMGKRLAELEPLLRGGDPDRGRAVFSGTRVACSRCHRIGAEGGEVGPDLTKVGAIRSGTDILESIVFPSSTFAQGYETYAVITRDARLASGTIARQARETLFLRDSSGAEVRFRKDEIEEMVRQPTSIMPQGLEAALTREELRDLLAFLTSLR